MTALDTLRVSSIWDTRFDLPTMPRYNNPFIYMAYADLILRLHGEKLDREVLHRHYMLCEVERGLIARWPDKGGGITSWDEVVGVACMMDWAAKWMLLYLEEHDGYYNNTGETPKEPMQWNLFRLPFVKPYLAARAGRELNLASQLIWSAQVVVSAFKDSKPQDNGGARLRTWAMLPGMQKFPLCKMASDFWLWKMNRSKMGLRHALAQEPGDPALATLAPLEWMIPTEGTNAGTTDPQAS